MTERNEVQVLEGVVRGEIKIRDAAELLGYTARTAYRRVKRYREKGQSGLAHGLVGRPSNRSKDPDVKDRAISLFGSLGGGKSLNSFVSILKEEGVDICRETLRLWLIDAGMWKEGRVAAAETQN